MGGANLRFAATAPDLPSPDAALAAVAAWSALPPDAPGRLAGFPFADVVAHYQAVGRNEVSTELTNELRRVREALRAQHPEPKFAAWKLITWLWSTVDQQGGDYDSYVGARMLERLSEETLYYSAEVVTDCLMIAAGADLAVVEADALDATPSRKQRLRTRAALGALVKSTELAPYGPLRPEDFTAALSATVDELEFAALAREAAVRTMDRIAPEVAQLIDVTMLPTTRYHDEHMFIRSIQIFESLYVQVFRCMSRAVQALLDGSARSATAELDAAASRLEATPALYRVLTTMPPEVFAVIRAYTNGRSAVQSRAYRQIELLGSPRQQVAHAPALDMPACTLQEAYLERRAGLTAEDHDQLVAAMRRLDNGWGAMKRTHWGITLKIIGDVPGTGGTSGASYLKEASTVALFPTLRGAQR